MDTAKQKTITFEFSTVDFVPEDISNEFVKEDLLPQAHRDILIEQLNEIVRQLNEDPTKIPTVHFPAEHTSSSPNRNEATKKAAEGPTATVRFLYILVHLGFILTYFIDFFRYFGSVFFIFGHF